MKPLSRFIQKVWDLGATAGSFEMFDRKRSGARSKIEGCLNIVEVALVANLPDDPSKISYKAMGIGTIDCISQFHIQRRGKIACRDYLYIS